jgi:hypothetical protein
VTAIMTVALANMPALPARISATGAKTSAAGANASATGAKTSAAGANASATDANASAAGAKTSAAGANASAAGAKTSAAGTQASAAGAHASARDVSVEILLSQVNEINNLETDVPARAPVLVAELKIANTQARMATTKKSTRTAKKDTRVSKEFTEVTQVGLKARDLATKHQQEVGPRLEPNLVTNLTADLITLGAVVPAAKGAKDESVQATAHQLSALEQGHRMVTAVRTAVGRKRPGRSVSLGYGVGSKTSKLVVKDVKNALQKIVNRATRNPAEAATFGILPADVKAYTDQIAAIDSADQAQEQARAKAPQSTKERNATARRILDAVDHIVGAGVIAFANSPTERASFEALIKKTKRAVATKQTSPESPAPSA